MAPQYKLSSNNRLIKEDYKIQQHGKYKFCILILKSRKTLISNSFIYYGWRTKEPIRQDSTTSPWSILANSQQKQSVNAKTESIMRDYFTKSLQRGLKPLLTQRIRYRYLQKQNEFLFIYIRNTLRTKVLSLAIRVKQINQIINSIKIRRRKKFTFLEVLNILGGQSDTDLVNLLLGLLQSRLRRLNSCIRHCFLCSVPPVQKHTQQHNQSAIK